MNRNLRIIPIILVLILASCTTVHFGKMTPAQKYGTYRATFNDVIEHQYIPWAKMQPEEKKVLLRADVNPLIKDAEKALDVYSKELIKPGGDPEAKMMLFLNVKNDLYALFLKYGLKVDESKGGTQ